MPPTKATKATFNPLASPDTNVQYTNSTAQVGNLFGPAINEAINSGLNRICPPDPNGVNVTCKENAQVSQMVEYLDQEKDSRYVIQSADYIFTVQAAMLAPQNGTA